MKQQIKTRLSIRVIIELALIGLVGLLAYVKVEPLTANQARGDSGAPGSKNSLKEWELLGPYEAEVRCLGVNERYADTVYAAHFRHVFRSRDGGRSWAYSHKGFGHYAPHIYALLVHPNDSRTVYAGTNHGIFKSIDGGETWTLISSFALGAKKKLILRESPGASRFFAARGYPEVLCVSEDNCVTWREIRKFESHIRIIGDPSNPATIIVGGDRELLISRDGGENWVETELPGASGSMEGAVNPAFPSVLYVLSRLGGLQRSSDGGKSWSDILRFPGSGSRARGPWVTSIKPIREKPSRVLLGTSRGLFIGSEDGRTLRFEDAPQLPKRFVKDIVVVPNVKRVYAATDNGVYVSHDLGKTWSVSFDGFPAHNIYKIAALPSEPQTLFAMSPGSLFRSQNSGASWKKLDVNSHTFAIYPGPPEQILARSSASGNVARSSDAGNTWKSLDVTGVSKLWCLNGRLYAVFNGQTRQRGFFRLSTDGGRSWQDLHLSRVRNQMVNSVHVDPTDRAKIYVGIGNEFGSVGGNRPRLVERIVVPLKVIRTLDGGKTWLDVPEQDGEFRFDSKEFYARIVAGSTVAGNVLYAAIRWGYPVAPASVVRSLDGGQTWEAFGDQSAMGLVESLVVDPLDHRVVFVGCANGNVFVTMDSGETWTSLALRHDWGRVNDILPKLDDSNDLYIATDKGIFRMRR